MGPGRDLKLLVLSARRPGGHVNDPIHRGFFDAFPGEVSWYGPGEKYWGVPLDQMVEGHALVLVNMKKRVPWLKPQDFAKLPIPKGIVECDFCYEGKNLNWYADCRFDKVFFRNHTDLKRAGFPNQHWLPFSMSPSWLCRPEEHPRSIPVGFAGTRKPKDHYAWRNWAIEHLGTKVTIPPRKVTGEAFMEWFRACQIAISCSSRFQYDMAKTLIIPAAGAVLLSDPAPGLAHLLPAGSYLSCPMGDNLDRVIEKALQDPVRLFDMATAAHDRVRDRHLHAHRWAELLAQLPL